MLKAEKKAAQKAYRALRVFTLDPRIKAWLEAHDPQALHQAKMAEAALSTAHMGFNTGGERVPV